MNQDNDAMRSERKYLGNADYRELNWGWYTSLGTSNLGAQIQEDRKRKSNALHKNNKLPSVNLFSKLNIRTHNAVNWTKNYCSILIFLCFCQYLDKKMGTSCPDLSIILKLLPLEANHGSTSGWPSTWLTSTSAHIRALDHLHH